ncbi:class I SAM-dependent methyltransferase [Acinetobacter sp. C_4_1]|uniref:class I SAM-dependent methyltransferase n=1 Tax=unclassified Acinetobacter TaxID=196816 RepID=UPI0021B7832B|nr:MULTISPECIES: class I SAM-dependent methyltransferase [unclassified Acinetobacter]MCT8090616.1 class I SAM-dependent methyltransferase [Acinetobacter sp. F_3_1]MCT8099094.1 class I SAM-dependent methyltransferase [Acinetobacter sp. C_3_1]MCT8102167.1 class I SAM-dependent methyltransferase [Acinetobacter sp. C_4_1]MCT8135914.1 class I SAM-dependent methyltransferase [Acinetobacter sp. T_3_1]
MTQQLSEHRHISFTAHYTGYIWYTMGISHPVFATSKGKMLAKLVHPLESWAEKFVGGSMRTTLKQRHRMIDQHLTQLIEQHPDLQVLEIASGLSPRGWNFRQKFPHIDYRELDLPDMAKVKTQALKQIDANSPEVLSVDLFTADFEQAFHVFDPNRPLVVISEGLINYFNKDMLLQLLQAIYRYGQNFKELHYLTDIYPEPVKNRLANFIWASSKLLKWMSKSAFSFHFINPQQAQDFFQQAGFEQVSIVQPQQYFQNPTVPFLSGEEHLGDLVWMIHASKKNSVI